MINLNNSFASFVCGFVLFFCFNLHAQQKRTFEVEVTSSLLLNQPNVFFNLTEIENIHDYQGYFWRVKNESGEKLSAQFVSGSDPMLVWEDKSHYEPGEKRKFIVTATASQLPKEETVEIKDNGDAMVWTWKDRKLMRYRYTNMPVPPNVDTIFSRAGFLHPVYTLEGDLLTQIQPSDHYHHYGIWNPWTHLEYDGKIYDLWNLVKGEGKVRHSNVISKTEGSAFSELEVLHQHFITPDTKELNILNEKVIYRVWKPKPLQPYYILDVESQYNCNTDLPVVVKAYRYQGFSIRGPKHWNDGNVTLLTSLGLNKSNGNASRAKWVQVSGPGNENGESSFVFITNPSNSNYPEEIRIWPTGANNGKENVFVNFNPAQSEDWIMYPNQNYTLKYRVIISDTPFDSNALNLFHSNFFYKLYAHLLN